MRIKILTQIRKKIIKQLNIQEQIKKAILIKIFLILQK